MEILFKITLADDEVALFKENMGVEDQATLAEWLCEVYFWESKKHMNRFGLNPKIGPVT